MLKQKTTTGLITLAMVFLIPTVLIAADTATVLAPVLDDQTFAVVRISMTPTQLDALTQEVLGGVKKHASQEAFAVVQDELNTFSTETGKLLKSLEQAGASTLYGVFNLRNLPGYLIVAHTHQNPVGLIPIIKQLRPSSEVKVLTNTNGPTLVVAGPAPVLAQLTKDASTQPQTLTDALGACSDDSAVQLVLAPSPDLRSIVKQMLPDIPLGSGSIPLGQLVDNLEWAIVDLQTPPQSALCVTTKSPDAAQASRLDTGIQAAYSLVKQIPQIRETIRGVDALVRQLAPTQQGRHLTVKMDQVTTEVIMEEAVATSLMRSHRIKTQYACGSTVSDLGRAVLIYSNDHNDQFPPTLEDLRATDLRERGIQCPAVKTKDSYVYRGKGLKVSHSYDSIVLYDKRANHDGTNHRNVLFLDSHVEWVAEERFQELIRKDNAYRRKIGLPELPTE